MAKRELSPRQSDHEPLQFIRWTLLLCMAAEAAGLGALSRQRLHTLLFVSFAASRFYRIEPLRYRARRTPHGPYYRAAHFALGALVMSGLVDVAQFKPHPAAGDLQFEGNFQITERGVRVARILRRTHTGENLYHFLLELSLGAVTINPKLLDRALTQDLTYKDTSTKGDDTIGVGPDATPTVEGLRDIDRYLSALAKTSRRDILAAYHRVLEQRAA